MKRQLRVGEARRLLEFTSEPYAIYTRMGFQAAIDARDVHSGETGYLIVSAASLSHPIYEAAQARGGRVEGLSLSIRKESADRMAKYLVSDPAGE